MTISDKCNLSASAIFDQRTDGYFGRVNVSLHGKLLYYRVIRVCRLSKSDALADANEAIKDARETGQLMI